MANQCIAILRRKKDITENFITVWCPWGHGKGNLGLIQDIALYLQHNRENFDIHANDPIPYLVILHNTSAVKHKRIRVLNKANNISLTNLQASRKGGGQ